LVSLKGKSQKLEILIGPKFRSVVVYAPTTGVTYMAGGVSGPTPAPADYVAPAPPAGGRAGNGGRGGNAGRGGAAQDRNYICFEPMVGITDAMNLAHKGVYKELTMLPAGGTWEESFWVRPSGF
jgi:aldose 1-epimerase